MTRQLVMLLLGALTVAVSGCSHGPRAMELSHREYNDAYARVDSEELLLNIVRLRYNDPPAEVEVSAIAAQYELSAAAEARPFFSTESSADVFRSFTSVLPFAGVAGASRPTISLTPVHSSETITRFMQPISTEGLIFFAETSWPISTVFRLWLEGVNGVPNAPTASGPTRSFAPDYIEFQQVASLLQQIQDRGELTFRKSEEEQLGDPIALDKVTGEALVEARKAGFEYRLTPDQQAWQLVTKTQRLYLDFNHGALDSPEYHELVQLLNLKPGLSRYEVTRSTIGFVEQRPNAPPAEKISLVTRSLVQVLYYLSHGVEIPSEHLACGVAKTTFEQDGIEFDWHQVLDGLFQVKACCGKKPPANAIVAVPYRGYWFYIDDQDQATKSTFILMRPSRQLNFGGTPFDRSKSGAPMLTLPVGR